MMRSLLIGEKDSTFLSNGEDKMYITEPRNISWISQASIQMKVPYPQKASHSLRIEKKFSSLVKAYSIQLDESATYEVNIVSQEDTGSVHFTYSFPLLLELVENCQDEQRATIAKLFF